MKENVTNSVKCIKTLKTSTAHHMHGVRLLPCHLSVLSQARLIEESKHIIDKAKLILKHHTTIQRLLRLKRPCFTRKAYLPDHFNNTA